MSFNVIIMDDLNRRTGDNSDMIPKSENDEIFAEQYGNIQCNRNICDSHCNTFGKRLLDLREHSWMVILNGRCLGDFQHNMLST